MRSNPPRVIRASARRIVTSIVVLACCAPVAGASSQQPSTPPAGTRKAPLTIVTTRLPEAILRSEYKVELKASGGTPLYTWTLDSGELPPGLTLDPGGLIIGTPTQIGEYRFSVTVQDSGTPQQKQSWEYVLKVIPTLSLDWKDAPRINRAEVQGYLILNNHLPADADLTLIVVAVNEVGKAFALAYQHFTLEQGTNWGMPFLGTLPVGTYEVHADAIAELPELNSIYRARLESPEPLVVVASP